MNYQKQIDTTCPVIIIDVNVSADLVETIQNIKCKNQDNYITLLHHDQLANDLDTMLESYKFPEKTLYVFPGNGGKIVQSMLSIHSGKNFTSVYAKRIWVQGMDPVVTSSEILPNQTIFFDIECVAVIDDVVSSGKTMHQIYQRNFWKFPKAIWVGGAQCIRTIQPKGYIELISPILITNTLDLSKKVPINSLSTLINDPEMAKNYAQKNFQKPKDFICALKARMFA